MRVEKLITFPNGDVKTKRPPIIFVGNEQPVATAVISYVAGAVTVAAVMDYLDAVAARNKYYHEQIGVYKV